MKQAFLQHWHDAAMTTVGLFWMAFWAFALGYFVSSMIQVFVTRERIKQAMGETGATSIGLGTFFGFLSSSCSFAALSTTRSLFAKGAGLVPSLAFLLSSTNLVIELGIIVALFLGWQFVVGEYVGGIILILLMWLVVRLTEPAGLVHAARERARKLEGDEEDGRRADWRLLIRSREGWQRVASRYVMEWHMVWKDVTIGFTVAGIIAAFVPQSFFRALFIGSGTSDPGFGELLLQCIVGPLAAFFTFIGSMGNIPLAAVLYGNGVAFAGIMAFIFSDLVVLPVLRIQAQYYGWRMALYILAVFLVVLVSSALLMHYTFDALDLLPAADAGSKVIERDYFSMNYSAALNLLFIAMSASFLLWHWKEHGLPAGSGTTGERTVFALACLAVLWLALGVALPGVISIN